MSDNLDDLTDDLEPVEEVKKEPEKVEPEKVEPEETAKPQTVPLATLLEERAKRQSLEDTLRVKAEEKPAPDMFEDPKAYTEHLQTQFVSMLDAQEARFSEMLARNQHGAIVDAALEAAQAAGVVQQFTTGTDRWQRLVTWHQQQQIATEIGDPAKFKEKLEADIRARIDAELVAKQVAGNTPSLAGETNLGGRTAQVWSGPTPLTDILPD